MKNDLTFFSSILNADDRPWQKSKLPDVKIKEQLTRTKALPCSVPLRFEFKFFKPYKPLAKLYKVLIDNERNRYYELIHSLMNEAIDDEVRSYWAETTLTKKIHSQLERVAKIIDERNYSIENIDPEKDNKLKDPTISSETFIIQYLKYTLITMYMEIQQAYQEYNSKEAYDLDDLFGSYFAETDEYHFIKFQQKKPKPIVQVPQPKQGETNSEELKSFKYKYLNKEQERISDLCSSLKRNGFIDKDTHASTFKKVFTETIITDPIVWTGNKSELYYFIKLLTNTYELVEFPHQQNWNIAVRCFVMKDKRPLDAKNLKGQNRPEMTYHKIESCVSNLNL